jgi:hypothetical protein
VLSPTNLLRARDGAVILFFCHLLFITIYSFLVLSPTNLPRARDRAVILFFVCHVRCKKKIGAKARCRLLLKLFITENSQAACAQIINLTIAANKKRQPKLPFSIILINLIL